MPGEVWAELKLSDVLAEPIRNGFSPTESQTWTGVQMLGLGCLSSDGFNPDQLKNAPESVSAMHPAALRDGDLLVSRANTRTLVGMVGIYREIGTPCIYPDLMMRVRPSGRYSVEFLELVLRSPRTRRRLMAMAQGTSESMVKISGETIRQLPVPDVPVSEQRRIVDVIGSLTELERGIEDEIRKLELIGARVVQRRLDSLYSESDLLTLADVASVKRGKFSARPRNDPTYFGGAYGFIQTGDVSSARRGVIWRASQHLNDAGLAVSRFFPAGTIVVTIAATIGETALLGLPMCFPDSVVGVVANDGVDPRFLELCLHRVKSDLEAKAPQSAQRNINLQDLRPLTVPDVSRSAQAALVSLWETYRDQVAAMKGELAKLRSLKQGLTDDLLSGRVAATAVAA